MPAAPVKAASRVGWDVVFRRPTREQPPEPALLRRAQTLPEAATRLDAAYRMQLEAVSRAHAEEAALLGALLEGVRAALPALVQPLVLLDVGAPSRPQLLHVRTVLVFGEMPRPTPLATQQTREGLFLREDASFLGVRFTGATTRTEGGHIAFATDQLEAVELGRVLRDHTLDDVAGALQQALSAQTIHRHARTREVAAYVGRLQALRLLLGR